MVRKLVLTAAFMFLPAAAMAQDHSAHHAPAKKEAAAEHHKKSGDHHMKAGEHHKNFAEQLIEQRADLQLSEAQVKKLEALSAEMTEHHKGMGKNAEHDNEMEEKMHAKVRAVFTPEQMKKVHTLMVKHAQHACGGDGKDDKCELKSKE
jgi:hypothetical protein